MPELIDITDVQFEHCVALRYVCGGKQGAKFLCRCECGKEFVARSVDLRKGRVKSCGCVNRRELINKNTKHGYHDHPIYFALSHIKQRCCNPKCAEYQNYGGRGITVCDEWLNNPKSFIDWSIQNGWRKGLTIDRIDNDKGYEPSNCRWVDMNVQENNKRNNHFLEYKGRRLTISQWSKEIGISRDSINYRILNGWTIEETLNTPVGSLRHNNLKTTRNGKKTS